MDQDKVKKLNELLSRIEPTDENQRKIKEIKKLINDGNLNLTLKKIDELFSENNMEENEQESKKHNMHNSINFSNRNIMWSMLRLLQKTNIKNI